MTDYVITGSTSAGYPKEHYGAHFTGNRATFFEEQDFATLAANALAIPNLKITVLSEVPVVSSEKDFGIHISLRENDTTATSFGTVRSHDMYGGKGFWHKIQTTSSADPSTWLWSDLDSWVNTHYAAGRDLIINLFGTPSFFSS